MAYIVFFPYQICQVDHKKSSPLHIGKNLYPTLGTLNKLIYQSMKPIDEQIEKKYLQLKLYLLWMASTTKMSGSRQPIKCSGTYNEEARSIMSSHQTTKKTIKHLEDSAIKYKFNGRNSPSAIYADKRNILHSLADQNKGNKFSNASMIKKKRDTGRYR